MNIWVIPALAFAGTALVVAFILHALTARRSRLGRRLKAIGDHGVGRRERETRRERTDRFSALTSALERQGQHSAIERQLQRAGVNWLPSEAVAVSVGLMAALAVGGWLAAGPLGAAAGVVLGALAPLVVLKALEAKRLRQFERQLPDALMLIASSLRSGYGILRAMQAVRDEMEPPISVEFARVLEETNVGVTTPEALRHLAIRVPLSDLDIAVTAILIQLDVGGNLAEIMEIVASTVRERQRIRAEVNTLTAEGRMSGVILFILPLAMAVVLAVLNPSYMSALFTSSYGHLLIACAVGLQVLGGLVINRMLQLDF